ncbi:hypothetical protein PNEG_02223 [Pneumocystis murina B123]|uniref:tRNA N(3)-methylcytidine methyltransferase n=1 Tax=Pneumocystis murina (strain B123) TaxID=1069680 RepID=M7P6X4_PNEMU|nr:hypothetical protein PNEG_02223 [Pneumocystis murina B123]EMR09640.1 hypothetical protein PNEG_02223 [Pneumocystis murina B123]
MVEDCIEECVSEFFQKLYEKDNQITTFSVDDMNIINQVKKPFRSRYLTDSNKVFSYNAWDDVEWDDEQKKIAIEKINKQMSSPVIDKEKYMNNQSLFWDKFYQNHKTHFFKNRKWLFHEFPQIFDCICSYSGKKYILEIGCGVGNTMFPILLQNKNPFLVIHGVDYSRKAIEILERSEFFSGNNIRASVWDMANLNGEFPEGATNVDIVILIFAFSSLSPSQWNIAMLKPGGIILFRDYGRWDMTQLRFKKERFLEDNFYIRGDGTRVYFFSHEQIPEIFGKLFKIERNELDKRLLVNRATMQKMYRIWIYGVFKKI